MILRPSQSQAFGSRLEGFNEGSLTSDQLELGDGMLELQLLVSTILRRMNTKILLGNNKRCSSGWLLCLTLKLI